MLTKEQIVQMLADSDITKYEKLRADFMGGNLYPMSNDAVLWIMIKALSAYDKVIQEILKELD